MPTSLCNTCYQEIDAVVSIELDGVYLTKECPEHGQQSIRIEENIQFYARSLAQGPDAETMTERMRHTALDVTQRCNIQCPHCYALPENSTSDPSIEELVELAGRAEKGKALILMGAEPTMRKDLPELVEALKSAYNKPIGIYTNAIKLANSDYADRHCELFDYTLISLHTRSYLPNEKLFEKKLQGIENLYTRKATVGHISFSLQSLDELDEVFEHCLALKGKATHFRIRTPGKIGICSNEPFYLSRLYQGLANKAREHGAKMYMQATHNTPYHVNVIIDDMRFRLIHFPSVEEINLDHLRMPPYALFVPSMGESNIVHQFVVQAKLREDKGGCGSIAPAPDTPS